MPSATIHNRFAQTAERLIDKHGRTIQLVTVTGGGSDFDPTLTETLVPVVGVQTYYKAVEVDGDLVRQGDKMYLIDSTVTITTDQTIRDDLDYSIVNVDEIKPGTKSILYKVQARV